MTLRTIALAMAVVGLGTAAPGSIASSQQPATAAIHGTVRDVTGRPIANAQIFAFPTDRDTRTDSAGGFSFAGLGGGAYRIRARQVGFAAVDSDVQLNVGETVSIALVFKRFVLPLDTVRVTATAKCSRVSLDGFACRRGREPGVFLDYSDITSRNAEYRGDLFRGVQGFRVQYMWDPREPSPPAVEIAERGWRCIHNLVNGRPADRITNPLPAVSNILAMEIYREANEVPVQFMENAYPAIGAGRIMSGPNGTLRMSGPPSFKATHEPCGVVIYWTLDAPRHP